MILFLGLFLYAFLGIPLPAHAAVTTPSVVASAQAVPFYSQFKDISSPKWQKVGCGVTSLAMIVDYYKPKVAVNTLLNEAISLGAYSPGGWTYAGLIATSKKYGLTGAAHDLSGSSMKSAYAEFATAVAGGPVIASVHYKFDPKSTIPHLVVINSIKDGVIHYNDPAAKSGDLTISVAKFEAGWKKRYIVIRPKDTKLALR